MRKTVHDYRSAAREVATELRGMLRRLVAGRTSSMLWQLLGYAGVDGERETFDRVEVFQGVGFAGRPRAGQGEVIAAHMGGRAGHPVGIASRDASIVPELDEDETAMFNSQGGVKVDQLGVTHVGTLDAAQSAIRGDAYRNAEDATLTSLSACLTAMATFLGTIKPTSVTDGGVAAAAAATACGQTAAAISFFQSGAAGYVSPKVKVP